MVFRTFLPLMAMFVCLVVAAQEMPACATACLQSSLESQDTCAATNTTCICTDATLIGAIQGCVLQNCTLINALAAKNSTDTMCGKPVRDITHITPIVTGTSGGAALLAVVIRIWVSRLGFWVDDALILIAIVAAIPMAVLEFMMSRLGFGKDIWTLKPEDIYAIVKYTWGTEICWFMSVGCTKLAFLTMYLRIFPHQRFRKIIYALISIVGLSTLIFTIIVTINCLPITYIWTAWDGEHTGKCINLNALVWAHAIIDIFFDCVTFALPIPELIKLNMNRRKKIMIILMFSVGGFGTIISIVRLQALVSFSNSTNPTYDNCPTAYWSVLACFVGIFCCCMPSMRRYLAGMFPSCFQSTQQSSKYNREDYVPNARLSGGKKLSSGKMGSRSGIGSGLTTFGDTAIGLNDDEQELVHMKNSKDNTSVGDVSNGSDTRRSGDHL